jgi:hypothetical protein
MMVRDTWLRLTLHPLRLPLCRADPRDHPLKRSVVRKRRKPSRLVRRRLGNVRRDSCVQKRPRTGWENEKRVGSFLK